MPPDSLRHQTARRAYEKHPCKDDGSPASRKEPLTGMHDLRPYRGVAHAVFFCHGQNPILAVTERNHMHVAQERFTNAVS